jgi:DNA-binding transcriptional regulator YhcF (GntR family)
MKNDMNTDQVPKEVHGFRERAMQLLEQRRAQNVYTDETSGNTYIRMSEKSNDPSDLEAAIKRLEATFVKLEEMGLSKVEIENLLLDDSDYTQERLNGKH